MNYPTKVQAIRRKKAVSQCYVNLPLPLAAAIEMVEWKVDTRYKLFLIRQRPKKKTTVRGFFSRITIITIYQLLSVCRSDNRDNIVLIFA
jgi:hypothetical protein